ncbi:MAG TPA: VTT domain-containing protein [Bacilli bacterium]|nr:VTT domain-containing protein [Bacilli bacterium]
MDTIKKLNKQKHFLKYLVVVGLLIIFTLISIDFYEPMRLFIKTDDFSVLQTKVESYGIWRYFFIAILHAFQVLLTIVPAEPVQILAGLTCGRYLGFVSCLAGIFVGNTIIFLLVRVFKAQPAFLYNEKQITKLSTIPDKKPHEGFYLFILALYFAPIIPYGIIAYRAADSKTNFIKYSLLTTLGTIPSLIICIPLGSFILHDFSTASLLLILGIFLISMVASKFGKKIIAHLTNRSIRASLIWSLIFLVPFILVIYFFFDKNVLGLLITYGSILLLVILYLIFNKGLSRIFEKRNKKYNMAYFQGPVQKINKALYNFLAFFMKIYFFIRFNVKVNKTNLPKVERPSILLFNHPSKLDFMFSFLPYYPQNKVNTVVAYYYFCNRHLGKLLRRIGGFPKYLFQPDISAIKNISRVMKNNGILGLAPEGRLSAYGELETIIPSTAKLIKKLGVQVIISKINGAYFSIPKWAKSWRRGRVEVEYKEIFSAEQLETLTVDEIYQHLVEEIYYDEFAWQAEKRVKYKGRKFAEGLEQILYICPICHQEYSYEAYNDTITCSHCHTEIKLNNYYDLVSNNRSIPNNIKEWYLWQKEYENKRIASPDYSLTSKVTLKHPDLAGRGFKIVGQGTTTLTHLGVRYHGTINGEDKELFFKISGLPAIPFGVGEDFEIYDHNTLYYFIPENIRECVKWSVVGELIYQKYIKDNNINLME